MSVAALLSGCWTPPSADVRPGGEPRIIEHGVAVESQVDSATVVSVDRAARIITLRMPGGRLSGYEIARRVRNWGDVQPGDRVRATLENALTLYVAESAADSPTARVLLVDASYRLLVVQYPSHETETFKVGLHAPMRNIEPGDSVAIRAVEVIALRVRHH